jgi:phosphatidylglycerophosphate synthase
VKGAVLYYPANLIGFVRLGLAASAYAIATGSEQRGLMIVVILLVVSRLLDNVDGALARRMQQETTFGMRWIWSWIS